MQVHVGTSGWHYDHWRGVFYPADLPKGRWLEFYAHHFGTVELNNSFYHLPSERAFATWRDTVPEGFTFAVKGSRLITHLRKLRNVEQALANFLERARLLGPKLGPVLFQLPPNLRRDDLRLETFLAGLPKDLSFVFEFRHSSWLVEGVFDLLRRYNSGFCIMDLPGQPCPAVATSPFVYMRFHGSAGPYWGSYSDDELQRWAERLLELAGNVGDLFVYFNNDAEGYAVANAIVLERLLKELRA